MARRSRSQRAWARTPKSSSNTKRQVGGQGFQHVMAGSACAHHLCAFCVLRADSMASVCADDVKGMLIPIVQQRVLLNLAHMAMRCHCRRVEQRRTAHDTSHRHAMDSTAPGWPYLQSLRTHSACAQWCAMRVCLALRTVMPAVPTAVCCLRMVCRCCQVCAH